MVVIPRWEWRSFGDAFDEAESAFAALPPGMVVHSEELYVLAAGGTDLVKLRDGLMDVKQLQQVSDEGLEQWRPVLKAPFPLTAADVAALAAALGVDAPADAAAAGTTLGTFLDAVVRPHPELRAVRVHKHRVRYVVDGCMAELTDVHADDVPVRTVAVESEDPAAVLALVERLGLSSHANVNYGRGLKALGRFGVDRFAVIDVGTNSVKFHVGERGADGRWSTVADRAVVTRLGEGLRESGALGTEPMARTVEAIAGMADEARAAGVAEIVAVGTAGLRIASNADEFVRAVRDACGVEVEVISGADEARLAYLAATAALPAAGPRVVFDTGGGSSQFTFGEGDRVDERFSVDVGAVRFTEQFGLDAAVPQSRLDDAVAAIAADLDRLDGRPRPDSVLAMGGAVTNLAAVSHGLAEYDPDVVQGTVLDRAELDRLIELFRTRDAEERRSVVGLQPARAEVVLAGACIVRTVLDKLGQDSLTVSDRGLRYGVLADRFDPRRGTR
ncbi:hypothetical protein [Cellulomonas sp.]|uniref:Ppx/GppA phosphatase family protein n=1 Tax=Cellulomonas sp. TaxID=40001 RepID=UPI001B0BAD0D|nr:hypothetical protein [Cellulomonas sp.]MBO9553586.1 hypothetical protein [Cellulomonas sp.]